MADPDSDYAPLVDFVADAVGDDLRAIDYFDRDRYANVYIRDDVMELYTERQFERMRIERVLNAFSARTLEEVYEIGSFVYAVRRFEEAMLVYLPIDDACGLVVSLDDDAEVSFPSFGDRCLEIATEAAAAR